MSSIKAWLYSGRAAAAAPAPLSASNRTSAPSDDSSKEEKVTSISLADMSEQSRAAAAGKAGEHFADMALGDGFGALVSFDSTPSVQQLEEGVVAAASEERKVGAEGADTDADANADAHPSESTDLATTSAAAFPDPLEVQNSTAQVVPEPDFLLDADGFGAILCAEMEQEDADVSATIPSPEPQGALYPEVANWLARTNQGPENTGLFGALGDKGTTGKSRPSLIQRIDRYLFPPSKLIVDGTLVPSPASPSKLIGNTSKLEVDFPPNGRASKKRDRSLIGTAKLGSIVGVVSRRSSQLSSGNNKTSMPPSPPTLRSNQVLLWGATTVEAHYQQIRHTLETARGMHGADGLRACGFDYRIVPCEVHSAAAERNKISNFTASEESLGQHETIGDNNTQQNGVLMKSMSIIDDTDSNPEQTIARGRSLSDAGVSYGSLHVDDVNSPLPKSAPTSHNHHQMIIVPSYAPNVGDLVESAAIRERKVRGFADASSSDAHSRMVSVSSETSLSTVFDNMLESDDDADSIRERTPDATDNGEVIGPFNEHEAKEGLSGDVGSFAHEQCPDQKQHDQSCLECMTRLFHITSDAMITEENWNRYIAFGDMYDEISRMCQEFAQDQMMDEGGLIWVTICEDSGKGNPIRALVDEDHSQRPGPILLVITGKGKVRTGIFSRRHLLTSGVECSTALPMVREAKRRGMKVAMIDPNARGEREGMSTFEMSVRALFGHTDWDKEGTENERGPFTSEFFNPYLHDCPLYVLAHSAAGGQLCRYLLDQAHHLLPQIAAIVFTDSTHNIQWAKRHESLQRLLESPACVYLRSSNVRNDNDWGLKRAGDVVDVDHHWRRRFGNIETLWAGTAEHSLMNWTSHHQIWQHFDKFRIPDISQGVKSLQNAIDESLQNGQGEVGMHDSNEDHQSVATFDSGGSLPHKSKRDRSIDLITL